MKETPDSQQTVTVAKKNKKIPPPGTIPPSSLSLDWLACFHTRLVDAQVTADRGCYFQKKKGKKREKEKKRNFIQSLRWSASIRR